MRVVYLDETGHAAKQPIAAVAGVLLNPDTHSRVLADRIDALKEEVPSDFRDGYVFHATDLYYGGKHRHAWDEMARWALLDKVLALPREFGIPIAMGFTPKPDLNLRADHMSVLSHAIAYALCLQATDDIMVHHVPANEDAMIVAEERPEAHKALRLCQKLFSDGDMMRQYVPIMASRRGPITRLKAPPAFASKEDEILLQIADACAFVFQRALNKSRGADRLLAAMFGDLFLTYPCSTVKSLGPRRSPGFRCPAGGQAGRIGMR